MSVEPNNFLNDKSVSEKEYELYYSLDLNKRKSLAATNYWRVMNGLKEIPVPPTDYDYHKYFDKKCYERAESFRIMRDGVIEFRKQLINNSKS
jgi:hypothetical protein